MGAMVVGVLEVPKVADPFLFFPSENNAIIVSRKARYKHYPL